MTLRRRAVLGLGAALPLSACVSIDVGRETPAHTQYLLQDDAPAPDRRTTPLIDALLIQPLPADPMADTLSIAYTRGPGAFGLYQFATWAERPVRQLPRLLQRRLEARGLAGATALLGEPLRADWLLTVAVDTLHHDVATAPGRGRLAVRAGLIDRRRRIRVASRQFSVAPTAARADSEAAVAALSLATSQVLDALTAWLESELKRAAQRPT